MQPGFIGQCLAEEMPWACLSRGSLKGFGGETFMVSREFARAAYLGFW